MRTVQRAVVVTACGAAMLGGGATAATAGEITGKGRTLQVVEDPEDTHDGVTVHGKSICAFSGLNDEWVHAQLTETEADDDTYPQVQNPTDGPFPGIAGYACNPVGARPT